MQANLRNFLAFLFSLQLTIRSMQVHSEDNGAGNEIRDNQKAIVVVDEPKENNGEAH